MDKPYQKNTPSSVERQGASTASSHSVGSQLRDEKRLTTAPIRERPKYTDLYKTNFQLPVIRGKNVINREPIIASRDFKRSQLVRKEEHLREHDVEELHKRPQTSKGSRNTNKIESEYYQEGEDDLVITSMQQKIGHLKKISKDNVCLVKHP